MSVLSVPVFGGGVVLEGSADAQRTDELADCQSYDIGARGQLVATTDLTTFAKTTSGLGTESLAPIFGIDAVAHPANPLLVMVGNATVDAHVRWATLLADGSVDAGGPMTGILASGYVVTFASFPYVGTDGKQKRVVLVCTAARSFVAPTFGPGLYALVYDGSGPSYTMLPISEYDALGTGPQGEFAGGSFARQLYPRGIVAYNNHAFAWGFDDHDKIAFAVVGDGPNRLMFSNLGNPLKWGRDPQEQAIADGAAETNRQFEDSDAITVGGSGEAIRCCYPWRGKLWIGTNRELHYLEGFGRESFQTNGSLAVAKSRNVIGPKAMVEGPDALLYGVSDEGLWRTDGGVVQPIGDKLRDYNGFSTGWWDLIWSDPSRTLLEYPGRTNQDAVWMFSDKAAKQVWVVIPYCDATVGRGYGTDTVIIKYHTETGGFTRQVFAGKLLWHGAELKREAVAPEQRYIVVNDVDFNIQRYGYKATQADAPALPTVLPDVTFGEYAPFGPDGVGVMDKRYLTLSWRSGALPLVFQVTPTIDGQVFPTITLTIGPTAPGAPADGDVWVDTSGTDLNLGNGTAGTLVGANAADYIMRSWVASWNKWVHVPGGGQQGTRITVPIEFSGDRGSRLKVRVQCTSASGRFQVENFSEKPAIVSEAA